MMPIAPPATIMTAMITATPQIIMMPIAPTTIITAMAMTMPGIMSTIAMMPMVTLTIMVYGSYSSSVDAHGTKYSTLDHTTR